MTSAPLPDQSGMPGLNRVTLVLCDLCLSGAGGQCHVPGCALWMNRAPDISLRGAVDAAAVEIREPTRDELADVPEVHP